MNTNKDFTEYNSRYISDFIYSDELTLEQQVFVERMFRYSNPQYYYLQTSVLTGHLDNHNGIYLVSYSSFANGVERAEATALFKDAIESWINEIEIDTTDVLNTVKSIHDLVCENITYNHDVLDENKMVDNEKDDIYLTQSAYSALCFNSTVCAGYAHVFEMLCNAIGVDCISVTGYNHEWNKVLMNGSWYNVDCTFDDQESEDEPYYTYFARSDYAYSKYKDTVENHTALSYWDGYLPECTMDTDSYEYDVGTLSAVTDVTKNVTIKAIPVYSSDTKTGKKIITSYSISMSCKTNNSIIYYTTDGTTPSVASSKSYIYSGKITVTDYTKVRAVAATQGKLNSSITSAERAYKIKYNMNDGSNNGSKTKYYLPSTGSKLLVPERLGYTFDGWYSDKDLTKAVTKIQKNKKKNYILYAKWMPNTYKIKFYSNSGSGTMSSKVCKYGKSYRLPTCSFTRKNYIFIGWNTKADGTGISYSDETKIKNLTTKNNKTIKLYAQWKHK
jgi:uncharacterized repeat protein (TIGR02543 family)